MRSKFLPFAIPDVDDEELLEVKAVLESGWLTTGAKTKQFEANFASYVGAKHAIAVNSCTAALHLALEAAGVQRGDRVVTTPYTFAASAEVIRYFDAVPVFADIEADSFNIDPAKLADVLPGAKAIVVVDIAGAPCRLDEITAMARAHNAIVIEDAAHALPTRLESRMVGALSDFTCFSFYATKTLTTAEGGMICTDNDDWADRCRIMSLHGISRDAWKRYGQDGSWYYEIIAPGYKYNMPDLAAAIGLAQLRKVDRMWKRRTEIAARYDAAFGEFAELQLPHRRAVDQHAWHLYMLRVAPTISRDDFVAKLKEQNIGASVHFIPLHLHPYYRDKYGYTPESFPIATAVYRRELSLPIYSRMTDGDVDDVIEAVTSTIREWRTRS